MKRPILVTGAAGFIGSRYVEFCNVTHTPLISVDKLEHFKDRTEHENTHYGEIVNRDDLFAWLKEHQPQLAGVIHLGACTDTTELDEEYLDRMNTAYSKTLWSYCTEKKIPFVYASSAATYGGGENGYDDDESIISQLRPLNPYGESKRLFDLWALDEERAGRTPPSWAGFKFFNVYGYGERHKGSMASVVIHAYDQIRSTGKVKLFRSHRAEIPDGHQKRDFIFVEDVVSVLDFALRKPLSRGIFNLGTGEARTFVDLVTPVFQELGQPVRIDFIDTPPSLRERYQYFTEAKMVRLKEAGYTHSFTPLEAGVKKYVRQLKSR